MSVAEPGFAHYRPTHPSGHAILLCQGGGYSRVGRVSLIPQWYQARGFHVFDLAYRLPHQKWAAGPDVALQDAQQAIRLIRHTAGRHGITGLVGVMGFSSGGHVAGSLATRWHDELSPIPEMQSISARPDFAILHCPVLTMLGETAHEQSRANLFGTDRIETELERRSVEKQVTAETPSVCLIHAADDPVVSVDNSIEMFLALKSSGVPAELHVPDEGGHRLSNCYRPDNSLSGYGDLVLKWLVGVLDESTGTVGP